MKLAFVSWSGGKDCCLASHQATQDGLEIKCLANMLTEDGTHSRTHGLSSEVLRLQSRAIGRPLKQRRATWDSYEDEFKKLLASLKRGGINDGVFGDIDLDEHREWVERVCRSAGITPHLPLWGRSQDDLLQQFISLGFEALVIAVQSDKLGEEWLGRTIDINFIQQLAGMKNVTPCGEAGEYHTLVVNGPIFRKRLAIRATRHLLKDGHWFLQIVSAGLRGKE